MDEADATSESTSQGFEFVEIKLEPLEDEKLGKPRSPSPNEEVEKGQTQASDGGKPSNKKVKIEVQKTNKGAITVIPNEKSCAIKTENEDSDDSFEDSINNIWEPELIVSDQNNLQHICETKQFLSVQENCSEQSTNRLPKNNNDIKHNPLHPLEFENKSSEENKKTDDQLNKHFECPVCHKFFTFVRNLQRHMTVHSTENIYECNTCGKCFSKRGHFEEHCTVHSDARPHQCQVCNRSFKCKSTLARHSRLHTSNHPHHCPVCNKVFTTRQHLDRHIQTHTGEKPFKCHICESSFSQSSSLTRHLVIHSGEKPHVCSICKKAFSFQNDLKIHTRIHTGEKPYSCPVCNKSFTQKGNLVIHMRVHKPK